MEHLFPVQYSWLFPVAPLIGAMISGFFGAKWLKDKSHWPIWIGVGFSALLSLCLLFQMVPMALGGHEGVEHAGSISIVQTWYHWIQVGKFDATAGAFIDPLTAVMLGVVCCVGFLITVFSRGYMKGEEGYFRFFAYLGLFIFAMTLLVLGSNFLMLYLGWEGVGVCSYLLIGYYYERPAAREAAKKAFLVNRIGDFGFGIGIMLIYLAFGTVNFFSYTDAAGLSHPGVLDTVNTITLTAFQQKAMCWIPFLLMLGAFGKSAQFPLYVWLPDAMEGPTPVSALIHAATMVTAGVYMIARCSTLFVGNSAAMLTIAAIGTFTAILAASIALRQFDLKKVFAYSTISQLGFMFAGVVILAPVAGVFHLVTHAFFKALLFLSSGVVMHAMAGELDMRKMSGLKRVLPKTNILMLVGCCALAGFPLFSGFWSKDEIVGVALDRQPIIGAVLLFTAFLTAYYTFRLYFRVFQGPLVTPEAPAPAHATGHELHEEAAASESAISTHTAPSSGVDVGQAHGHDDHGHDNHEPWIMMAPLFILAIGAIFAGYENFPHAYLTEFLGRSPSFQLGYAAAVKAAGGELPGPLFGQAGEEHVNVTAMAISAAIAALGIILAYYYHLANRPASDALATKFAPVVRVLEAKFWVDEIYQALIVTPLRWFGIGLAFIDRIVIDGIVAVVARIPAIGGWSLKLTIQRGYLQGYAAAMLFGVAIILLIIFL